MENYSFEDFKKLLENDPLIICDTNVLLRPYRVSVESMKQTLQIFQSIKDLLWLPHQVRIEFQKHCEKERTSNFNKYRSINSSFRSIIEKAKNSTDGEFLKFSDLKYPKIEKLKEEMDNLFKEMQLVYELYEKNIEEEVEKNREALKDDGIKALINEIIEKGNVGSSFTMKEELEIYIEGEQRYKYKYPPGHEDLEKDNDDPTGRSKYGDLLIWKQVLHQARETGKDVIFVSRDVKKDWWELDKDKKPIRPRKELFREFKEETSKKLIVCTDTELFKHLSVLKQIDNRIANVEMRASEICYELANTQDWQIILDGSNELTSYLVHSGDLQDWIADPLSDVEVIGVNEPHIFDVDSVEFFENEASFQGRFETNVEMIAYTASFGGYRFNDGDGICKISGYFSLTFDLDSEDFEKSLYKLETVKFEVAGFVVEEFESMSNSEEINEEIDTEI